MLKQIVPKGMYGSKLVQELQEKTRMICKIYLAKGLL